MRKDTDKVAHSITYIKKDIKGFYVEYPDEIDAEYWEGMIGTTYPDFLDGKWIRLSDEQVQFHKDYPSASISNVLKMELPPVHEVTEEELLQRAKQDKISELDLYDTGSEVNEFTINDELKAWFTPEQRSNYKNSIDSAELLGVNTLQLLVAGNVIELETTKAAKLLAMIQLYADSCYMVTEKHKAAINACESVDEVEAYDFTTDYPEKLNFEL